MTLVPAVRTNVDESYRAGVEFVFTHRPIHDFSYSLTTALSQNRIKKFDEKIFDYDTNEIVINQHFDTPIAFSPSLVTSSDISYAFAKGFVASLQSKYVGRQFS